ncbi:Uncharacterised protein [Escherichia coli]|nr:Uncharacterised protein [Escherichia coli]CTW33303.1 Uncharacterised protein [Escherichia coli]CTZ05984.1 Uncharacterised protein [Escherichia coli]
MFQELPVKFCAGATFITGFNGSGYSDGTFFLYCLFVRNGGANKGKRRLSTVWQILKFLRE